MILSVYSASTAAAESTPKQTPRVLPLEPDAKLDNEMYVTRAKQIQTEEELSHLMGTVHNTLLRYLLRQSHTLLPHDTAAADAPVNVEQLLTDVQARLFAASENKLHVTTSATPLQRKLAHGTYTLYLRALVATWRCIMSVAERAKQDMREVDEHEFMQQVLQVNSNVNVAADMTRTLADYHARVHQCVDKVEQLRRQGMQQLWAPSGQTMAVAIPLDMHMNMFKNYLSQVRAWLQQQPALALP